MCRMEFTGNVYGKRIILFLNENEESISAKIRSQYGYNGAPMMINEKKNFKSIEDYHDLMRARR